MGLPNRLVIAFFTMLVLLMAATLVIAILAIVLTIRKVF